MAKSKTRNHHEFWSIDTIGTQLYLCSAIEGRIGMLFIVSKNCSGVLVGVHVKI